jgi:hypothetical protein
MNLHVVIADNSVLALCYKPEPSCQHLSIRALVDELLQ